MNTKKIIHVTGVRELGSGQRKQLTYEFNAAKKIENVQWDVMAIHSGEAENSFEKKIPNYLDFILIRNLYFWFVIFNLRKKYDLILFRHLMFDPFVFIFAPFIKNRASVHHSKEIEELRLIRKGVKGVIASFVEKNTGKVAVKNSLFIVGVTEEIGLYENKERKQTKEILVYPNGIDINDIDILEDNREPNTLNILFICSYFSEWHGLDLLLESLNNYEDDTAFNLHLVGKLNANQKKMILRNKFSSSIICHGSKNTEEYISIASKCNIGIGSLAMFRQNLNQGSTLKVREMLAMGLPVFSGHKDVSFDNSFDYYNYSSPGFEFSDIIKYANKFKYISRYEVRNKSKNYIDKRDIMNRLIDDIKKLDEIDTKVGVN